MAVTIKDIAKRVGVSHTTVSRALRGSELISGAMRARIRQAAAEMGYQPSAAARSLKTNRSQVVGVIVSSLEDPFFSEILQGIEERAQACGYGLFIAASQHNLGRERAIVKTMRTHRVDGVIICSTSFSAAQARQLFEFGFPTVVVNNQSADVFRYSIYHDDVDGSRQLTRHLLDLGHRRIAYLGNALSGRTTLDRLDGFRQALQTAELPVRPEYVYQAPGGKPEHGLAGAQRLLELPERPSAIVCYNDLIAVGALKAARLAGLDVPADLSVTGFDNIAISAYTHPPLTTFDQPKRSLGLEAARLLFDLLESGPDDGEKVKILPGRLLERESTGPAQ